MIESVTDLHFETLAGAPIIIIPNLNWLIFKNLKESQKEICLKGDLTRSIEA